MKYLPRKRPASLIPLGAPALAASGQSQAKGHSGQDMRDIACYLNSLR
jgi:hypothetical protein